MNRTLQLQQDKAVLFDAAELIRKKAETEKRALTPEERVSINDNIVKMEGIQETISIEARMSAVAGNGGSRGPVQVADMFLDKPFGYDSMPQAWENRARETKDEREYRLAVGFGEQLQAIKNAALNPNSVDPRLLELNQRGAPAGAGLQVPADGGFLVYPDFSTEILTRARATGLVYPMGYKLPLSTTANGIKVPGIDETSRANGSRWGGVQMNWQNEADTLSGSKPKFRVIELVTKKLTGLFYSTDELLADAAALGAIVTQAFGEEVGFKMDDAAINGDGSGKPQGILTASALVTVNKESGQTATTINIDNVVKMWARCWPRSRMKAVWFINADAEPQLWKLASTVGGSSSVVQGVGNDGVKFYVPPGTNGNQYGLLMGRDVIPIEQCQTLGTAGDIILADMTQWLYCDKGDMQQATSIHVKFLTDETTFRWIYRVDGQPLWNSALTPFKGSSTLSPFVALQSR